MEDKLYVNSKTQDQAENWFKVRWVFLLNNDATMRTTCVDIKGK